MRTVDVFVANDKSGSSLFAKIGWDEKENRAVVLETKDKAVTGRWMKSGITYRGEKFLPTKEGFLEVLGKAFTSGYMWATEPYDSSPEGKKEGVVEEKNKVDEKKWLEDKFVSLAPALNDAVRAQFGGEYWVSDFSADQIILSKSGGSMVGDNAYSTIDYYIGEDGKPVLVGVPIPVVRKVSWEPENEPEEPEDEAAGGWKTILDVPKDLREKFNYRLELAQEWQKNLIESEGDEKKAWVAFHLRWVKGPTGRWVRVA